MKRCTLTATVTVPFALLLAVSGCNREASKPQGAAAKPSATASDATRLPLPASLVHAGGRGGDPGNDYPWQNLAMDSRMDPWGELVRECTSFAAWALASRNHFTMPFYDDAVNWGPRAKNLGYTPDSNAAVGAIAWSTNTGGHVAYVSQIDPDGTVWIEEYNHDEKGDYDRRPIGPNDRFQFIHFKDLAAAPSNPAPANPAPAKPVPLTVSAPQPQPSIVVDTGGSTTQSTAGQGNALQPASGSTQGNIQPVQGTTGAVQGNSTPVQGPGGTGGGGATDTGGTPVGGAPSTPPAQVTPVAPVTQPTPSISAAHGGAYGCADCSTLDIAVHNFPVGTYTYACHDNSGPGGSDTVFFSHAVAVTDPNQSTWPGVFCDDNAPYIAYLTMDGYTSNPVQY